MSRPEKELTQEQLSKLEILSGVLTVDQLASYFGIHKATFYRIMERDEEVKRLYKKGKANMIGKIASKLVDSALDGNLAASIFYLKTQAGWGGTINIHQVESEMGLTKEQIESLSTSDLKLLKDIYEKVT